MIKYTPVSSFPEVSGDEYDAYKQALNWIDESRMYYPDIDYTNKDYISDLIFTPTNISKNPNTDPKITPKEELPEDSKPISIPKKDTKKKSTIAYTDDDMFKDPKTFVNTMYQRYIDRGVKSDIAKVLSVQKLLESTSKYGGFSFLATEGYNFGGIKARGDSPYLTGKTDEYINGNKETITDIFRKFSSLDEYLDYEKYLYTKGNFKGALTGDVDHYFSTINGDFNGGLKYATAPNYRSYLENMVKQYFPNKIDYLAKKLKGGKIEKASLGTIFSTNKPRGQRRSGVSWAPSEEYYNWLLKFENHGYVPSKSSGDNGKYVLWGLDGVVDDDGNWQKLVENQRYSHDILLKSRHKKERETLELVRKKLPRFDELPEGFKTAIFDVAWNIGGTKFQAFDKLAANVETYLNNKNDENLKLAILELGTKQRFDGTHYNNFGQRYIERASWASGFPIEVESPYGGFSSIDKLNKKIKELSDSTVIYRTTVSPILKEVLLKSGLGSSVSKDNDYNFKDIIK